MERNSKNLKLPDVYDGKAILGEHLYIKVSEVCGELAEKITGMLLECSQKEVYKMLQDEQLLQSRIDAAMSSLQHSRGRYEVQNGSLEERIFYSVEKVEPKLASKITGMLLELDENTIQGIVDSPQELQQAIQRAKTALIIPEVTDETTEKKDIGDSIFDVVEAIYPNEACKITGMLMELEMREIQMLLQDGPELERKIHLAYNVLTASSTS